MGQNRALGHFNIWRPSRGEEANKRQRRYPSEAGGASGVKCAMKPREGGRDKCREC